jgi:hypothetical protein
MSDYIRRSLERITKELAANKTKAAVLGVMLLVLVFAIGRVLLSNSGPAPVEAVPPLAVKAAPVDPAVPQVRPVPQAMQPASEAPDPATAVAKLASVLSASLTSSPSKVAADGRQVRKVAVQDLPRTLSRDLCSTSSWSKFPREGDSSEEEGQSAGQAGPSLWDQMRGALSERRERRIQDLDRITTELSELKLQSTMNGPIPSAYISGRLVHERDKINGFSVVRIGEKRVVLRKNGVTRSLIMP